MAKEKSSSFEAEIKSFTSGTRYVNIPQNIASLFRNSPIVIVTIEENKEAKA